MSDAAAPAEPENNQPILGDQLFDLGSALPESGRPAPSAIPVILGGLVRYLETGSLVPPEPDERPSDVSVAASQAENARIADLEDQVNQLKRADAAASAGPSPVAPAPPSPVEPTAPEPVSPTAPAAGGVSPDLRDPADRGTPAQVDPPEASPVAPAGDTPPTV